ncbi:bone morphogenetic protein 2-like [Electrophorus electricus]|uniref:bone morphogenetic protein 2-like n=1 Tax=Electrophorus electricus TaxID=8005 RepID=UPI0015CFEC64|nr:bone morphogenetic protein 2-like [Electrophorus electricus]
MIPGALKKRNWNELFPLRDLQRSVPHKKVPQFMKDLYDAVADSDGMIKNSRGLDGNVVRSFAGQTNGVFHFFNLTSFGPYEKIIKAEFRWFRRAQPFLLGHHFHKVNLYEVLDNRMKPWRGNLITSRLLPMYSKGWEVFNITQTVTRWILSSDINNGILVVSTLPWGPWFRTAVHTGRVTEEEENYSFLVIYSNDSRRFASSGQNSESSQGFPESKDSLQALKRRRRSTRGSPSETAHSETCQRTPLYVDFAKIGWSGWIISPRGYNAYHCVGSCPFPLSGSLRATNHAIVQSIVNTLKLSSKVERPCCVPDVLYPISLLYFDDEENVVLKQYDDMVAGNCACH